MENYNAPPFDIYKLLGIENLDEEGEPARDPIGRFSPPFDPFSTLPNPLHSEIVTSSPPSSSANALSPTSTEEDAAAVDNLLKALSPDILQSLVAIAETPPELALVPPDTPSTIPTASSASPTPASPALFSPVTVYTAPSASPPVRKRRFSFMDFPDQSQEPTPGPSVPRPTKRPCTTFPGESEFQLDTTVAPLQPIKSAGQQMGKPREPRGDYSACKCEGGQTSKPARHWRVCPYNLGSGAKPFKCNFCPKRFGREDNLKRHIKEYHPEI
ncbi:hypothetical protein M407DRAFT_133194 [Tulasnella calospora MUT 4182]|uniref:C2H2-type domain-containing protein n=1 Tax=Tulasnella calospora MUT 4182 TaxID=1051891 RepID=A0A0C3QTB5_9AGAM|nr:hypothetical protein M407DRAFT_133194 [Tulasnella calospora MUT 4182]